MGTLFYILWFVSSLGAVIHLLLYKREPSSTIAWLLFTTSFPIIGPAIFFVFGPQRLERQAIKRSRELEKSTFPTPTETPSSDPAPIISWLSSEDAQVLHLARRISQYGVTAGNHVHLLPDPHQALLAMKAAIAEARRFIHLEYYIIESDEVTRSLFEDLLAASHRGIEVRILYDSLGSLFLKRIYFRRLIQAGAKIAGFLPVSLLPQRINLNFRNHRKILIVDGKVAFTGGTNIGKKYLGLRTDSQWLDYTTRIQGAVCRQLEDVFAKDWHFTTQEDLFDAKYYPAVEKAGDSIVQVLESGPDSTFLALHQALFFAINSAKHDILLTTPYFIPDPALITTLTVAALKGINVKLLLPAKSDSRFVQYASRSFYDDLLQAGVQIYEYQPRVLHAKIVVIDKKWTILGSANMDIRSFRLNFELNLLVYGAEVANQAVQQVETDLGDSLRVDLAQFVRRPLTQQVLENACRLMSPIL